MATSTPPKLLLGRKPCPRRTVSRYSAVGNTERVHEDVCRREKTRKMGRWRWSSANCASDAVLSCSHEEAAAVATDLQGGQSGRVRDVPMSGRASAYSAMENVAGVRALQALLGCYQQICVAPLALDLLGGHSPPLYSRPPFRTIAFLSLPDIADRRALHTVRPARPSCRCYHHLTPTQVNSNYFTSPSNKHNTQPPSWGESTSPPRAHRGTPPRPTAC
jgi:hypothetical protein